MQETRKGWLGRRLLTGLMGALVIGAVSLGVAPAAMAQEGAVAAAAVPQFPASVTVGAQNVPVSLSVQNQSTGEVADDTLNVDDITLTPSCGSLGFGTCPPGGEDPGVFVPSATGVGSAGTACAGQTFSIILLDPATGRYRFAPDSPVVLGPTGTAAATCIIDFTVDVVRAPTKDANPAQPGLQTNQYATVALTDITPGPMSGQTGSATGIDQTTVLQAAPQIATQVDDATITLGQSFTDTATVTGPPGAPTPTGAVNFFVYGPDDAICAGVPVATSLNRPLTGGAATSDTFSPNATGTYRVIARYSGDANYTDVSGACNDPNETVVVEAPPPPPMPTTKEQCMNGGWRTYGVFKNQGDCVSFVATKGKNPPAGPKK